MLRPPLFFVSLLILFAPPARPAEKAPSAQQFTKLENCRLIANRSNDGDSFHVQCQGKEYIFRLYFVDAPEAETDATVASRVAEQAQYFHVSEERALQLGNEAAAFASKRLSGPFTVFTRFKDALGRSKLQRFYGVVMIGQDDLAQLLVKNGLARIYGVRTPLPDGSDSRAYLKKLAALESQAKRSRIGGWKPQPASTPR